jgi:hypothetical protein
MEGLSFGMIRSRIASNMHKFHDLGIDEVGVSAMLLIITMMLKYILFLIPMIRR